jgi:NAD(P)-dependent dehydrogenase (short-subunit alcohol dehydrogenase family)
MPEGVEGKRVLITGATSGIGLAAARRLAALGAELVVVARSQARADAAIAQIRAAAGGTAPVVDALIADLASQASVRGLAEEARLRYPRIDVLVNNAGAIFSTRQLSPDGIERTWAVNHLAPFLLTTLLLDRLRASAPARVITTSSGAHRRAGIPFDDLNAERSYGGMGYARYGQTKLANILFTTELARRLEGTGVTANCFHPGFVDTGFNSNNGGLMRLAMQALRPFARRPEQGAETLVWLAVSPEVAHISGGYFKDKRRLTPSHADPDSARRLWQVSEEQTRAHAATTAR